MEENILSQIKKVEVEIFYGCIADRITGKDYEEITKKIEELKILIKKSLE